MKTLLTLSLLFATPSLAGTLECNNSKDELTYKAWRTDGGAPMRPSITLTLAGETLIQTNPRNFDEGSKNVAEIHFQGGPIFEKVLPNEGYYRQSSYYQEVLVLDKEDPSYIHYSGTVFCIRRTYTGPPMP